MDDKSTPKKDVNKDGADSKAGNKRSKKSDTKAILVPLVDACFGALELLALVFWMLSENIFIHNKGPFLHEMFLSLAGSSFLVGAAHFLSKAFVRKRWIRLTWLMSVLLSSTFTILVFANGEEKKPFFTISMLIVDPSDNPIPPSFVELTNSFLMMGPGSNSFNGSLLVPKRSNKSELLLQFKVNNDSHSVAELPIELSVWIPKKLKSVPGQGWTPLSSTSFFVSVAGSSSRAADAETESFLFTIPTALLGRRSYWTDPIKITAESALEGVILARVESRNAETIHLGFETVFMATNSIPKNTRAFIFKNGPPDDIMAEMRNRLTNPN